MKPEEIAFIQSKRNAAIIAPAGHGKTEMITDLVDRLPGKKLVLTHTNAGVEALNQRLQKKTVGKEKCYLSTISSFCMKWCNAYPYTAHINPEIRIVDKRYYPMVYAGAVKIFQNEWARRVIKQSYSCIIVDEYQDCVLEQHHIFEELNESIPVYVLGDPLQAIFGFAGQLVRWKDICFEIVSVETHPWRWEKTNPELGLYLSEVREKLYPGLDGKEVTLSTIPNTTSVHRISPSDIYGEKFYGVLNHYETVLYIAKWPDDTSLFARRTGGLFQNDEAINLTDLYKYTELLDSHDRLTMATAIMSFLETCASGISSELGSYVEHVEKGDFDFSRIRKHSEFGAKMLALYERGDLNEILSILDWVKSNHSFKLHRRELYSEMQRAIRRAREKEISITQAAQEIRLVPNNQSRYSGFKRLSSRTLLSKGLEFDCVIIDLSRVNCGSNNRYSATDMYVAMTRAKKSIYFITCEDSVLLSAPKGVV